MWWSLDQLTKRGCHGSMIQTLLSFKMWLEQEESYILRLYRLKSESKEKCRSMERLIIKRCLPAPYRKDVGVNSPMYVTEMDSHLWEFFLNTQQTLPTINRIYMRSYPDHGHYRNEDFHCIGWLNGNHPDLHTPCWYLTKWYENGIVYKAYIYSVNFIRNCYSGLVRCEFEYHTWFYDNNANGWRFC